jgi:hypothetical protein
VDFYVRIAPGRPLLATWVQEKAACFFRLRQRRAEVLGDWIGVEDLNSIFSWLRSHDAEYRASGSTFFQPDSLPVDPTRTPPLAGGTGKRHESG